MQLLVNLSNIISQTGWFNLSVCVSVRLTGSSSQQQQSYREHVGDEEDLMEASALAGQSVYIRLSGGLLCIGRLTVQSEQKLYDMMSVTNCFWT